MTAFLPLTWGSLHRRADRNIKQVFQRYLWNKEGMEKIGESIEVNE